MTIAKAKSAEKEKHTQHPMTIRPNIKTSWVVRTASIRGITGVGSRMRSRGGDFRERH